MQQLRILSKISYLSHISLFSFHIFYCRRLVDMLQENEDVISFCPGFVEQQGSNKTKVTLGRIVVHDRLKVEANILPRYFNHSSFASLRRQLNYFSFTRLGKGRQRGATYCNEAVMELQDILRLKRRSTSSVPPSTGVKTTTTTTTQNVDEDGNRSRSLKRAPRVSISSMEELDQNAAAAPPPPPSKRARHSLFVDITSSNHHHQTVSDSEDSLPWRSSSSSSNEQQQQQQQQPPHNNSNRTHHRRITLDLTTPLLLSNNKNNTNNGEDDVLAGSQALLSFARAFVH